jgi:hypothetical protein
MSTTATTTLGVFFQLESGLVFESRLSPAPNVVNYDRNPSRRNATSDVILIYHSA